MPKKILKKTIKKAAMQPHITHAMTISQVLEIHPKAADIMQQFGLHCFGCSINVLETLEQGIIGHGMPESTLTELMDALNSDLTQFHKDLKEKGISLSEKAALKIAEIAQMEGRKQYGIRVKMGEGGGCCKSATYSMDFENAANEGDKILGFHHGVTLFIDKDSFQKMHGSTIDYITSYDAEGFKIENPNVEKEGCACKSGH